MMLEKCYLPAVYELIVQVKYLLHTAHSAALLLADPCYLLVLSDV